MAITLKQLEAFVWITDLGSFRAAAERLNTTQPNISTRIASLESALGVVLMERDAGSVRLTAKGRHLMDHARQVLRSSEALIEAAGDTRIVEGVLRLGVTEMIVHTWLRAYLRAFRERYPAISVELTVDMSADLEQSLFARSIDLALQNGPFVSDASGHVALGRYPLIWVAAPELELGGSKVLDAEDLSRHPILTHARGTRPYRDIATHFRAPFRTRSDVSARLVPSSNLAACMQMSMDGMGIAALPAAMVRRELASGELEALNYGWQPEALDFVARFDALTCPAFVAHAAELAQVVAAQDAQVEGTER